MRSKKVVLVLAVMVTVTILASCDNPWWPEKDNYTVTFHANGGTGTAPAAQTVVARSSITLPHGEGLTKAGYTFAGWNKKHTGDGDHHHAGTSFTPTGHITLYAKWTANNVNTPDPNNPTNNDPGNNTTGNGNNPGTPLTPSPTTPGSYTSGRTPSLSLVYNLNAPTSATVKNGTVPATKTGLAVGDDVKVENGSHLDIEGYVFAEWVTDTNYVNAGTSITSGRIYTIIDSPYFLLTTPARAVDPTPEAITLHAYWLDESKVLMLKQGGENGGNLASKKFTFAETEVGKNPPAPQTITILNTDESNASGELTVTIKGSDASKFTMKYNGSTITDGGTIDSIGPKGNSAFTIEPNGDLEPGNYSIVVEIKNSDGSMFTTFVVGYEVKPHPLTLKVVDGSLNYRDVDGEYTGINWLTPLEDGGTYTERTATFKVEVKGFKSAGDVSGVGLKSTNTALSISAVAGNLSGDTLPFTVTATYDGSAVSGTQLLAGIETNNVPTKYFQYAYGELPLNVNDGLTATNPIPVYDTNIAAFNYHANNGGLARYYKQMVDITLTAPGAGGSNWTRIGDNSTTDIRFTGNYDGNGKKISNLTINNTDASAERQAMFGFIGTGGKVEKLTLENVSISSAANRTAAVAGSSLGIVENCFITGTSSISGARNVGGVVATNAGTMTSCSSSATIIGSGDEVGGLAGANNGMLQNSHATGSVSGANHVGGLVGDNYPSSTIQNSYAEGNVTGTGLYVGGVAGVNNTATVKGSYATGNATGSGYVGGVVGYSNGGTVESSYYTTGAVSGSGDYVGGVVGHNNGANAKVQSSYATGNVEGSGNNVGGVVGNNVGGTVQNTVALSQTVTGANNMGRVVGQNSGTMTNNYARSDMKIGASGSEAVVSDAASDPENDKNGKGITSTQWNNAGWWTGTAGFDSGVAVTIP